MLAIPWRWMTAPHNIYEAARKLARPVVRGSLPLAHAYANLMVTTLQEERSGRLAPSTAHDAFRFKRFLLQGEITRLEAARDVAWSRIRRAIAPMIGTRRPSNAILAEAHGINGAAGFPFAEEEVTDIVREQVWYALPPAPKGRRHAG